MKNVQPLFDTATHYQVEVRGRVDSEWLQTFDSSAVVLLEKDGQREDSMVLNVHTDQSGIVGLVRRLHGLGMTILQVQIIPEEGKTAEIEDHL